MSNFLSYHFSDITVTPLLFKKGNLKLALYGLSNLKDERLHHLFIDGKVQFCIPQEDTENWFNMLVLHQNRQKKGTYNYIPEARALHWWYW